MSTMSPRTRGVSIMPIAKNRSNNSTAAAVPCLTRAETHIQPMRLSSAHPNPIKRYATKRELRFHDTAPAATSPAPWSVAPATRTHLAGTLAMCVLIATIPMTSPRKNPNEMSPPWRRGMERSRIIESSSGPSETMATAEMNWLG